MRPRKSSLLLLALACALLAAFTQLPASAGYEFPICGAQGYQAYPAISGSIVVWGDQRNAATTGFDIYGYDLSTGQEFPICTAPGEQGLWGPDISGNTVVWQDTRNHPYGFATDIYGYDLGADTEFPVCTGDWRKWVPKVSGNIVVWADERSGNWDIYGYDLSAGREFPICTDPGTQFEPDVCGDIVVYYQSVSDVSANIWAYRISTGDKFLVCAWPSSAPAIFGNLILWGDHRNYWFSGMGVDIYAYDLSTGEEFLVMRMAYAPAISGNLVVATKIVSFDPTEYDICGYDLAAGQEFPICTAPGLQGYLYGPDISNGVVVWEDWRNDPTTGHDIYGYRLDGSEGGGAVPGPEITEFTLTPDILAPGTDVVARLVVPDGVRVELQVLGLRRPQPAVSMNWDGSAWVATISGSLARWAQTDSLLVTATAFDSEGRSRGAARSLAVAGGGVDPGTGEPNSVWVDEGGGCGILDGDASVVALGPLVARLRMTTMVSGPFGVEGPMNIWPKVRYSAPGAVVPADEWSLGANLAHFNRFSPSGGPAYDATFEAAGDRAVFWAGMDATAFGLTLWDTAAGAVAVLAGVPELSPTAVLETYDAFAHLAPVQRAVGHFDPPPSAARMPKAISLAAWELSEFLRNSTEREALRLVLQEVIRLAKGDPKFVLSGSRWLPAVGQVLSYWHLLKICRDLTVWAVTTWNGDPYLAYVACRTGTAGALTLHASSTLAGLGSLVRAEGADATFDLTEDGGLHWYNFTLTNTAGAPLWEWRLEFGADAPMPESVTAPPGWDGEVVWGVLDRYVRWWTEGPQGWASGDFGPEVIEELDSRSLFGFSVPERIQSCTFSATDTDFRVDGGMVQLVPGLLAAPAYFNPAAGETTDILCYLDRPATATVAIYQGDTPITILLDSSFESAGELIVTWDGKGPGGQPAPTGEYEVRLALLYEDATSALLTTPVEVEATFADVPWDHWARAYIQAIYREGITEGCMLDPPRYCPDALVTRGQMAVFICKAAGKSWYDPGSATFSDVPRGANGQDDGPPYVGGLDPDGTHIFYGYIERLADGASWGGTAVTGGWGDGTYRPTLNVTRGQIAKFLCIANGKTWYNSGTATFPDVPRGTNGTWDGGGNPDADGTHVFYGWIERLADAESWGAFGPPTVGFEDGTYRPKKNCTRTGMAVFLCRAFEIAH